MKNTFAVISVIYENYQVNEEFIGSFRSQDPDSHIYLADLSKDKKEVSYPHTTIIPSENKGYAHGVNLGIAQARKDGYTKFVISNNDIRISNNFSKTCIDSFAQFSGKIVGGKIYYEKGYEYHKDRYAEQDKGNVLWYAGGIVDWKNVFTKHRGVDEVDKKQYDKVEETEFVTGCLMLYDQEVYQHVGDWNESYFMYYEDADFCERAKRSGIQLVYNPALVIWHKSAQSVGGTGSKLQEKYQNRNRLMYGLKYAPLRTKIHLLKNFFLDRVKKT